jgi:hypothetical protein
MYRFGWLEEVSTGSDSTALTLFLTFENLEEVKK